VHTAPPIDPYEQTDNFKVSEGRERKGVLGMAEKGKGRSLKDRLVDLGVLVEKDEAH
jgi:hypothetical protein